MCAGHVFAARALARYSAAHEVWVSDLFYGPYGYSTVRFLAPKGGGRRWTGMENLPFAGMARRPVVVALGPGAATDLAAFARAYPHARFTALVATGDDRSPIAYAVFVPWGDVKGAHGAAVVGRGRAARFITTLQVPSYGRYRLAWEAPVAASAAIRVDRRPAGPGTPLRLAAGLHRVEVRPGSHGRLVWARPGGRWSPVPPSRLFDPRRVPVRGLLGRYRGTRAVAQPLDDARVDPQISFDELAGPAAWPLVVDWSGSLYAPVSGRYLFETDQVGSARLALDGRAVSVSQQPDQPAWGSARLVRGWHDLRLRHRARNGLLTIRLKWSPPGLPFTVVPSAFLRPPGAAGPPALSPPITLADGALVPPDRLRRTSDLTRAP